MDPIAWASQRAWCSSCGATLLQQRGRKSAASYLRLPFFGCRARSHHSPRRVRSLFHPLGETERARVCFQRQVAVAGTETVGDLRGTMSDDDHHFESKADAGASKTFPQQAGTIRKNAYLVIKTRPCKVCFPPPNLVHSACRHHEVKPVPRVSFCTRVEFTAASFTCLCHVRCVGYLLLH
jgi:hypothetical protein